MLTAPLWVAEKSILSQQKRPKDLPFGRVQQLGPLLSLSAFHSRSFGFRNNSVLLACGNFEEEIWQTE